MSAFPSDHHPPSVPTESTDAGLGDRIRILAIIQIILAGLLFLYELPAGNIELIFYTVILVTPAILSSIILYALRTTRYAVPATYINLTIIAALIALADPISGVTGGEVWVLFQIWPPLAFLTLRRARRAALIGILPLLLLIGSVLLMVSGVIPMTLLAPTPTLLRNLFYQVVALIVLSIALYWISQGEEAAWAEANQARARLRWELDTVRALVAEKDRLNTTLEQRVAERSEIAEQRTAELTSLTTALQRQTGILQSVLDSMGDGVVVTNADGQLLMYNPAAAAIFGTDLRALLSESSDTLLYLPDQTTHYPAHDLPTARALRGESVDGAEMIVLADDRPPRWLSITARPLRDPGELQIGSVAVFHDITARRQAAAALQASEERYALASYGANDGLWDWDLLSGTIFYSPRWKAMLGYREAEIGVTPDEWFHRLHPEDRASVQMHLMAHTRRIVDRFEIEYRIAHRDGSYRWMLCRGLAVWNETNQATRIVGSQTDITDRKLAEERLRHEALHDTLTGLPNRALFMERLAAVIKNAQKTRQALFAVLFIDLDRFKTINDSLGHLIGDRLLIFVAQALEGCLRPGDTVARLGGDEFTVLLDPLNHPEDATFVAERIQQALSTPIHLDGQEVFTSASIGIALGNTAYERPEDVLRDADAAMYQAKLSGKACYAVFDNMMHTEAVNRLQLDTDLRRALERQELRIYYQPILSLQQNRLVGFEALVRWQHPERGLLLPDTFLALAEETGLITIIGSWVLQEACRQLADWQAQLPQLPPLTISINLSAKQLTQPDLADQIAQIVQETGLHPSQIVLEIMERTLNGMANLPQILENLKNLGVRLSLDDFGTGYAVLGQLYQFPKGTLKIDRSFVSRLGSDQEYITIVTAIIAMARALGLDVIAEGIETPVQRALLQQLHCDCGQGWLFAQPLDGDAVQAFIERTVSTSDTHHG